MKKYIFITLNLTAMNGADMYIYNKKKYLEANGFQVYVFSGVSGNIMIHGLREYKNLQTGYLRIYPGCFRRSVVNKVLDWMKTQSEINEADEVIVESSNKFSALWAELLAQNLHCKHLFFILTESVKLSAKEKEYCKFKLERHEFAGIAKNSIALIMEDSSIPESSDTHISAACTNTIDNCDDFITPQLSGDADFIFGSIGRIDKPYVRPMCKELSEYFCMHSDKKYDLVMIGGARANKQLTALKDIFKENVNVNILFTGAVFPIPIDFVNQCDLFVSASGSAGATYFKRRPTIRLNPTGSGIIGITGLTYQLGQLGTFDDQFVLGELGSMIDLALEKKQEIKFLNDDEYEQCVKDRENEFARQLEFVNVDDSYEYFDTFSIKHEKKSYKIFNVLGKIMSGNDIEKLMDLARKCFK